MLDYNLRNMIEASGCSDLEKQVIKVELGKLNHQIDKYVMIPVSDATNSELHEVNDKEVPPNQRAFYATRNTNGFRMKSGTMHYSNKFIEHTTAKHGGYEYFEHLALATACIDLDKKIKELFVAENK